MISEDQYRQLKEHSPDVVMKDLHEKILDIYKEIKIICDKHNIRYFAEGGTWVGAALCQGFIPWDDDMDLRMPRKDYEKFLSVAPNELPDNIEIIDCTTSPYSTGNMLKVHDVDTTFIESTKRLSPEQWSGVFVDITPFDNGPKEKGAQDRLRRRGVKLFIYSLLRKKNHINLSLNNYKRTWWYSLYTSNGLRPPANLVSVMLLYVYIRLYPISYFSKKLDKLWQRSSFNGSDVIVCPERPWEKGGRILYLPREYYSDSINMKFCGSLMPVPIGYEQISELSYGFKPTLGVDEKLKYKHLENAIVDLSKPYIWYRGEVNK